MRVYKKLTYISTIIALVAFAGAILLHYLISLWIGIIYIIFSTIRTNIRNKAWKLLIVEEEVLHPILTEKLDKVAITHK